MITLMAISTIICTGIELEAHFTSAGQLSSTKASILSKKQQDKLKNQQNE